MRALHCCIRSNVHYTAAGAVLVQEAGGHMSSCWGSQYELSTRSILATNGAAAVHDRIVELLVKAKAVVPDKE
jgi:3'-phosphoadenosine 5'-phosphosulfate (PAPS) 3'-phosphatase